MEDLINKIASKVAIVRKTPNKNEWCVKSENNPDWSGGCYPSKAQANKRLSEVEAAKAAKKGKKRKKKSAAKNLVFIAAVVCQSSK
jgi:hypothetical protein